MLLRVGIVEDARFGDRDRRTVTRHVLGVIEVATLRIGAAEQAAFWRGGRGVVGARLSATARLPGQGVWLRFTQGASVLIDTDALFADIAGQGLRLVGVMTQRARGYTLVGLSAFVNNVVMFDHANRRMGFARGKEW